MCDWSWWKCIAAVGLGATMCMDLWSYMLRRLGIATLDYAMLGRWCGHWFSGTWFHTPIQQSQPIRNEKLLGWALHYLTGIVFAACLLSVTDAQPQLLQALTFGAATVLMPWLVMQPALGAGIAAAKTAQPWLQRCVNLATHLVFGASLLLCAKAFNALLLCDCVIE
ncbi:MAG TPA: DUF2938 family protein [Comamonas sp.]